ncbi:hypothetical protein DFH29DRAFT_297945 [Suillus ampliporus]|nr:hypothetical protein DFH29DRAFT_297945 [Suillus ampliporus]
MATVLGMYHGNVMILTTFDVHCPHWHQGITSCATVPHIPCWSIYPLATSFHLFPLVPTFHYSWTTTSPLHSIVDEFAIELTERLGSLEHFMEGVSELLKFSQQEDCELQRHGRKIIALTEVARTTLTRVGVKLYLFVFCSSTLLPFKSAYFKLLVLIRRRKHAFPFELDDRICRLLLPLYTHLVIRCGGIDPRAQLGIDDLLEVPNAPTGKRTTQPAAAAVSPAPKSAASNAMLPPDAFAKNQVRNNLLGQFIQQRSAKKSHAQRRLVPKQYPAGDETRLVPKQYPAGDGTRLVPKQYPAGDGTRLVPKQYPAGDGTRLVPKQYPAGDGTRLVPKQYPAGDGTRLVPKQYPAGDVTAGHNGGPSRPPRVLTRTRTQNFGIFCTGKQPVTLAKNTSLD